MVINMAKWVKKRVRVPKGMVVMKKRDPKTGKLRKMRVRRKGYMRIQWVKE
jgi:hypothetical protein